MIPQTYTFFYLRPGISSSGVLWAGLHHFYALDKADLNGTVGVFSRFLASVR